MIENENNIDDLIGKYLAKEASAEETARLQKWLDQSAENQRYFKNLETIFKRASLINDSHVYDADAAWRNLALQMHANKKTKASLKIWRAAAGFILVCIAGIWAYTTYFNVTSKIELSSAKQVVVDSLPDGTLVGLNKQSKIVASYNSKSKKGRVKLQGEANFKMEHDPEKEFIVEVDNIYIRDIGTVFNVKGYDTSATVEVDVQEGEVHFYTSNQKGVFVKAGFKGIYHKASQVFSIEKADTNIISYQTKRFVFEEALLTSVVDELNTIYEKQIVLDERLKNCKVTVSFNNEDITTIAEILAETLQLTIKTTESSITLEGEGCD